MSVVFPAPETPMRATISRLRDRERDAPEHGHLDRSPRIDLVDLFQPDELHASTSHWSGAGREWRSVPSQRFALSRLSDSAYAYFFAGSLQVCGKIDRASGSESIRFAPTTISMPSLQAVSGDLGDEAVGEADANLDRPHIDRPGGPRGSHRLDRGRGGRRRRLALRGCRRAQLRA